MQRSLHFRREHAFEAIPGQRREHAIVEHAGRVEHAADRQRAFFSAQGPFDLGKIRDVGLAVGHPRATVRQRRQQFGRVGAWRPARDQNDFTGAVPDETLGDRAANRARSSGHHVAPIRANDDFFSCRRMDERDLPGVRALRHPAKHVDRLFER